MKVGAVVYVKDLARMRGFYQACFDFGVVDEADDYCILESDAWTLSLVAVPETVAASIEVSVPPARRSNVPVKLVFEVAELGHAATTIGAAGGLVDPESAAWDFRGQRHLDGADPEGNIIQLLQTLLPAQIGDPG